MAARLASVGLHAPAAEWEIGTLDRILVACAEHELNASTFAARVVASTGADLHAAVLAALCSLSGPIHGGACDRIEQMFAQLDTGMRLEECLAAFSVKWRLPPGFGHAIYPAGDPRAVLLKKEAAEIVETVFDTIKETLERGEKIKISGFGNFVVRDKNARAGRNPQTGQEITISARRVLTFKPSQVLKNVLND